MKQMRKRLMRLLSAGTGLALLAGMLPGALAATSVLEYEVDSDDVLEITDKALNDYCKKKTDSNMDYIYFTDLPSASKGTLYYCDNYEKKNPIEVEENEDIPYNELYYLLFEPDEDFDGTVTIPFEGESVGEDAYWGDLVIEVTGVGSSSSSGELTYEIDGDETLELDVDEFDQYVYDHTQRGEEVKELWFTSLPSSSKGTLYYDYGYSSQKKVREDDEYDHRDIDYLTFVPEEDYKGTVTLSFRGLSDRDESFSGDLVIKVNGGGKATGDVTYEVEVNDTVDLRYRDFSNYSVDETGDDVDYIWFTDLPSYREGTLYYDYDDRYEDGTEVDENKDYDYDEIDDLTFVPYKDFEGTVTIGFAGKADNRETFSGELVIQVGDASDGDITVKLQAANGADLTFRADTFNQACVEEFGSNLDYVIFDYTSGRSGYLYYQYGQSNESEVENARYYRSSYPSLNQITFVSGSSTGSTVRIPFSGKTANGKTFDGEVEITYVTLKDPSVIVYTSNGLGVKFKDSDFQAACASRGGQALSTVRFLEPELTGGSLYYSFTSPMQYRGPVVSSVDYSAGGLYPLSEITFLPKAGYTGMVSIPYVGTDTAGITYDGVVNILVSAPTTSRFNDMGTYGWALPSVEFMAAYGITTGTGNGSTYSPAGPMTRGDYILMLCRTFGFTTTQTGNFTDVPAGIYYADALAAAKALGIATGDSNGAFHPGDPVTRQDAMVFLYKAMDVADKDMPGANVNVLNRFSDVASVAESAKPAVAAMVQAGVIQGNGLGQLNPKGTLTRAEMATILHRAVTL